MENKIEPCPRKKVQKKVINSSMTQFQSQKQKLHSLVSFNNGDTF